LIQVLELLTIMDQLTPKTFSNIKLKFKIWKENYQTFNQPTIVTRHFGKVNASS